jgi:membrane protein DedA with SNARE-associated domain
VAPIIRMVLLSVAAVAAVLGEVCGDGIEYSLGVVIEGPC